MHVLEKHGPGQLLPLVLLHGLSAAGVHFFPLLRHFARFSRVLLPDLPGHGFSDTPFELTRTSMLTGLYEALDRLLVRPALLCGNSLGGYTAIRYALERPEKVAGLLLASPAGAAMEAAELIALRERFRLTSHQDALEFVDLLFARPSRIRHLYALGMRRHFNLPQTEAVLQKLDPSLLLTPAEVGSLKMPVVLTWGRKERILPSSQLQFFRKHLPAHAQIEEPAEWGHSPFLDDPRGFARRIVRFGEQLAPTAPDAFEPRQ